MNHVNLIGKISSDPKFLELNNGRKIAQFSMSTQETFLDDSGKMINKKQWHRITAWGKWVIILEEFGVKGLHLAVEGKLVSRFYKTTTGDRKLITEVEINDLIVL